MAKESEGKGEGKGENKKDDSTEHEVRIYSLATTVNECIIFLEEVHGNRLLPIWIGLNEGQAIAIRFSGIVLPRPLTHDLLLSAVKMLGWNVDKVVVNDLKENTFYARIYLKRNGQETVIDSRPSDAIAVAVRAGCTIFVEEKVFQRCKVLSKPISETEVKKFKDELKNLRPEDIFKDLKEKEQKDKGKGKSGEPEEEEDDE
ncbi:MAG: bifunctional nuclease family protein [Elusimicrobia bacterium]|nr:bifunctional nuclease family protein [Elusimicrobiota bacterium]